MARRHSLEDILQMLHEQIPLLADRYGVEKLELFGSYVRDEQAENSDLDVLITYREVPTLIGFIALENFLSDRLGVRVDLVMKDSLKPTIGKYILREAVPV